MEYLEMFWYLKEAFPSKQYDPVCLSDRSVLCHGSCCHHSWVVTAMSSSGSVVLWVSFRQRRKTSPNEPGKNEVGIQVRSFEGDIYLNSSLVLQVFLLPPYVLIQVSFC